jgi:hypothetical protein
MSRKAILILVGLYFLAAVAFSFFRVMTNPFLSGLNPAAVGNAIGGALLLYGGAGLLPMFAWALYRFKFRYAAWPMLSWAFVGIALAYFIETGVRLQRDIQISILAKNVALSDAKLSCLESQHASKFRTEVGITEREISAYCGCISEASAASATDEELTYIAMNGKAPQPSQERTVQLARPCARLIGVK